LAQIPGKAIKHIATVTTGLDNGLNQHCENQLIGYKIAALQVVGCCLPDLSACLHFLAQEVSTGQVDDAKVIGQLCGLRSFARSWRRDQEHSH
jgi:hypothetical protein